MTSLVDRALDVLRRHSLGPRGIVAVSGGPDSVALAATLDQLRTRGQLDRLVIAHVNHQLRGPESDADERFVHDLAERWTLPYAVIRIDAKSLGGNLEESARVTRYAWLETIAQQHDARWIATGHTADDQAETVLHHFLRGSGLDGLRGIGECLDRPDRPIAIVRPFLDVRRSELREFLHGAGIPFRHDASNDDPRFTRNRLRRDILPLLEQSINPAVVEVLARNARLAGECQAAVTERALELLIVAEKPRAGDMLIFARSSLASMAPFWMREVIRHAWKREGWPMGAMNADDWRRLDAIVSGQIPRHDFPEGVRARATDHVVQLWRE